MILPEHMSVGERNARLYETLKGMGLFVTAVPCKDDPCEISYIQVSCGLPRPHPTFDVGPPVEGAEVGEGVASPAGAGDNVIDFPPIL